MKTVIREKLDKTTILCDIFITFPHHSFCLVFRFVVVDMFWGGRRSSEKIGLRGRPRQKFPMKRDYLSNPTNAPRTP